MKLASSSYYYQPLTDLQAQEQSDALLRAHIERLQQHFPGYGYRRLSRQLRREGIVVNDKKIRRVQEIPAISHPLAHFQDCHHRLESQPQGLSQSAGEKILTGIIKLGLLTSPTFEFLRALFFWRLSWTATRARSLAGRFPNASMPSCAWRP